MQAPTGLLRLLWQLQGRLDCEFRVGVTDVQNAVVFLRHSGHLLQAEPVGRWVLLGGAQTARGVCVQSPAVAVGTRNAQEAVPQDDAHTDEPGGPRRRTGCPLQGIVQQVHQHGAQVFVRDGKLGREEGRRLEERPEPLCPPCGILQNGVDSGVSGVEDLGGPGALDPPGGQGTSQPLQVPSYNKICRQF